MAYLLQFLIILSVTLLGEFVHAIVPLPVPACIYGLIIMFILLVTGVVKIEQVRATGKFLINIMAVTFVPVAVGLMDSWKSLQAILVPFLIIVIASTILVMGFSAKISEVVMNKEQAKDKNKDDGVLK